MLDGSGNGLLGKKLPEYLGVGAFNAMYIAAVSTSAGRVIGNVIISMAGDENQNFENNAFIPLTILSLVIVVFVLIFFRVLDANAERKKIK